MKITKTNKFNYQKIISNCLGGGHSFTLDNGLQCTMKQLEHTKYKALLKKYLLSTYPALNEKAKEEMLQRVDRFSKCCCVFVFQRGNTKFGLIYYLSSRPLTVENLEGIVPELRRVLTGIYHKKPRRVGLAYFFYENTVFSRSPRHERLIFKAIQKNLSPGVLTLLEKLKEET